MFLVEEGRNMGALGKWVERDGAGCGSCGREEAFCNDF